MSKEILGIHHVTAIASDPQRNVDFYTDVLGLRLVKLTVNFDDPGTYHFYYGDEVGRPGTILTFFPWPGAQRGRPGNGQVAVNSFSIPAGATGYWQNRLKRLGISVEEPTHRFDEEVLALRDPDGLGLELVAHAGSQAGQVWGGGPVPLEYAIRGFHSVTLWEENLERTAALLTETLGFRLLQAAGNRSRFEAGADGPGAVGTTHHIAWRTADDQEQQAWRREIANLGFRVSPVMDRQYFHSIYFREPGGVLFEIATDPPGFTWDESPEGLGMDLKLPPWLESERARIEGILPTLTLPEVVTL
jgi:catechol 2,3-dioxygenase-like lactoylglutathione lyase family enzyme